MKYLLLLFPSVCFADWTTADTAWQLGYTAALAVDCAQTRNMISNPVVNSNTKYVERNPALGTYPSKGRVDNICLATGVAHFGVSYVLPPDWRRIWQIGSVAAEIVVIKHNYSIGLRMSF